jgi:hypothetical protein
VAVSVTVTLARFQPAAFGTGARTAVVVGAAGPGDGLGLGDGDGEGDGEGDGLDDGLGLGEGAGLGEGVGDGLGLGEGDGEGVGVGVGDGLGDELGDGLGLASGPEPTPKAPPLTWARLGTVLSVRVRVRQPVSTLYVATLTCVHPAPSVFDTLSWSRSIFWNGPPVG